ncbi:hypothetical protein J8J40_20610, partial [Mycobacterium tuberculosis]|nr:hypothetical protein [Mycobacterium tuberculosis]
VVLGDPVELTIEVATPASLRTPDVVHDVRVALSRDPTLAPALANGHLHLHVALAPSAACSPAGKRRIAVETATAA